MDRHIDRLHGSNCVDPEERLLKRWNDLVFASEILQLRAKGSELLLHEVGPDLGNIFSKQPVMILHDRER